MQRNVSLKNTNNTFAIAVCIVYLTDISNIIFTIFYIFHREISFIIDKYNVNIICVKLNKTIPV